MRWGSAKACWARSNETPCFFRFSIFFDSSHSKWSMSTPEEEIDNHTTIHNIIWFVKSPPNESVEKPSLHTSHPFRGTLFLWEPTPRPGRSGRIRLIFLRSRTPPCLTESSLTPVQYNFQSFSHLGTCFLVDTGDNIFPTPPSPSVRSAPSPSSTHTGRSSIDCAPSCITSTGCSPFLFPSR